jgi:integrase
MPVTDRWHKTYPRPGDEPCKCGRGRNKKYPTKEHMTGDQWQVRWYDPDGKQRSRNFALNEGDNPDLHAEAFDHKVNAELDSDSYTDPKAERETFGKFAETTWLKMQTHDKDATGGHVEGLLRNHVLEDPKRPGSGLTPTGAPALGHHTWGRLRRYPSLTTKWIAGLKLGPSSAAQVTRLASSVYIAARDDGLISRNPFELDSVKKARPKVVARKTRPWPAATVDAVAEGLGMRCERFEIIPYLGAATAMRAGEMFGFAGEDIGEPDFFRGSRVVQVRRQVRLIRGVRCFRPLKNKKEHTTPVNDEFVEMLLAYMERFPPVPVTLPWLNPDGKPVTFNLIVTRPDRQAVHYTMFNDDFWKPALAHAGVIPQREPGVQRWAEARDDGPHRLRHTAVSNWLDGGASIPDVAEWIGDLPEQVYKTYGHMVPGAEEKGRAAASKFFARLNPGARLVPPGDAVTGPPQLVGL